jgi:hypothetical protein
MNEERTRLRLKALVLAVGDMEAVIDVVTFLTTMPQDELLGRIRHTVETGLFVTYARPAHAQFVAPLVSELVVSRDRKKLPYIADFRSLAARIVIATLLGRRIASARLPDLPEDLDLYVE